MKFFSRLVPHGSTAPWTVQTVVLDLPKQTDSTSCGVFISFYAYYWINYRKFPTTGDFVQAQVPDLRLFMASRLSSVAHGGLSTHLERNKLRPDMNDLPISLRNLFLDIPFRGLHIWRDNEYNPIQVVPTSPPASVRHRPVASPGAITASPQAKIAKILHNIASPGANSAVPTSPPASVRHRPAASPGAITASPQAKIAKIQHNIASPGANSAAEARRPMPSHFLSPSRDAAASKKNQSSRLPADTNMSPVRRMLTL